MKVVLGKYMDGGAWPDALHLEASLPDASVAVGVKICGPAAFISLLEERMGLPVPDVHGSERIAVWQGLLERRKNGPHAFYEESFSRDAWNTAKRVLQLRDELTLAGAFDADLETCSRLCREEGLSRLAELYDLEREHLQSFVPGSADRLRLILRCLREGWGLHGLNSVELVTPRSLWPTPWQDLFCLMEKEGVILQELLQTSRSVSSTAHFFQLESDDISESAEALAAVLAESRDRGLLGRTVILRKEESSELDGALLRQGLPDTGCRVRTVARPYIQILPLYLRLQFFPFDPETLRQFLFLPVSPLDRGLASRLLAALQRDEFSPYFDKDAQPALEGWPASWRKVFLGEDGRPDDRLLDQISWFCPRSRQNSERVSTREIANAALHLGSWAARSVLNELPITAELCARAARTLENCGKDISRQEFDKIIDSILGDGEKPSERRPAMPWTVLTAPGQIWDKADTVIWWDFTSDGSAVRDHDTWGSSERRWLSSHNCLPDDMGREREAMSLAAFQPLVHAGTRFIAVRPRFKGGEESIDHPLMSSLDKNVFERVQARSVLRGEGSDFWAVSSENLSIPVPALPWQEDKGHALSLPKEFYSSGIKNMLDCPTAWYLKNILNMDPNSTALASEAVLCGYIAHDVIEDLLKNDMPADDFDSLQSDILRRLCEAIPKKAARLALPEYDPFRRGMADQLARSYQLLVRTMHENRLEFHSSEQSYVGDLDGIPCKGRYDLALNRCGEASPSMVLDMKWSRKASFKEQIKDGLSIQLAAYAYLLAHGIPAGKQEEKPSPVYLEDAGYLLLPKEELLLNSEGGTPLAMQWEKVVEMWTDMKAGLEKGTLPLARAEKREGSPCKWCDFIHLCGKTFREQDNEEDDV